MTLVMNQLLDSKITEDDEQEEKNNQPIEKQEEDALVFGTVSHFLIQKRKVH